MVDPYLVLYGCIGLVICGGIALMILCHVNENKIKMELKKMIQDRITEQSLDKQIKFLCQEITELLDYFYLESKKINILKQKVLLSNILDNLKKTKEDGRFITEDVIIKTKKTIESIISDLNG
jgi:hypothetical protein